MFLSRCNCVIFLLVLFSIFMPNNSNPTFISNYCRDPTNRTDEATFQSNLTSLLDSLSSKSAVYSFYNYSIFSSFYGLFLCRGDVSSDTDTCLCIKTAIQEAKTRCGQNTTAIIWYDECMLRYSKDNFFGQPQTLPMVLLYNQNNRTAPNQPNIDATSLMYPLIRNASLSTMLFNASEQRGRSQNNYGLVQCTRDLDGGSCSSCLNQLMDEANRCCQEKIGWQMHSPSCSIRYENYSFFASPAAAPDGTVGIAAAALTPAAGGGGGKKTAKIKLATVIPTIVVAAMVVFLYHLHSCKKRQSSTGRQSSIQVPLTTEGLDRSNSRTSLLPDQGMNAANENDNVEVYELTTISSATNNFSEENKLGQGGFGSVYEGTLANGKKIAVKRLSSGSKQGLVQFQTEVMVIAKLRHINLVRLLGWCDEGNEMLLVYEYMINKSLDVFLSDPDKRKTLDWHTRASIIKGIARGIEYLHGRSGNQIVIHRDLKTSNVLLDEKMNPKISDFGIAKMFGDELNEAFTDTLMGTLDYMAPEYKNEGNYGTETDVYSFGVMLLEIVSGKSCRAFRESNRGESLLTYAGKLCRERKELELVDPLVVNNCQTTASRLIQVGVRCVQDNPNERPTMSQVVIWLEIESTPELSAPFSCLFSEGLAGVNPKD